MDLFTLPIFVVVVLLKTPSDSAIIFPISVVLSSFLMFQLPPWNHFHSVFPINDFSSSENVFISSSFLKDIFSGYGILRLQIFQHLRNVMPPCVFRMVVQVHVLSLLTKSLVCVSNFTLLCLEMEIFGFILFAQLLDSVDL